MHVLKQELAAVIADVNAGGEIILTRHNKPVARLIRPTTDYVRQGSRFGKASLKPAIRGKTKGRYLKILQEDRHAG